MWYHTRDRRDFHTSSENGASCLKISTIFHCKGRLSQSVKRVTEPKLRPGRGDNARCKSNGTEADSQRTRRGANAQFGCGMRLSPFIHRGKLRLSWLVRYSCSSSSAVCLSLSVFLPPLALAGGGSLDITRCYLAAGRLDALTPNAPRVDYAGTDPPRAGGAAVLGAGRRRGFVVPRAGGVEVWRLREAQPFTSSTRVCACTTWFSMQAISRAVRGMPCRVQRGRTVPCRACRMDGRYHRRA